MAKRSTARGGGLVGTLLVLAAGGCNAATSDGSSAGGASTSASSSSSTSTPSGAGGSTTGGPTAGGPVSSSAQGATTGSSGSAGLCPGTAFFCDDFEGGAIGAAPASPWAQDSQGVVTTDHAHSGSRAVRLDEGFNFQKLPLTSPPDVLYARVMMWSAFVGDTPDSRYSIMSTETSSGDQAAVDSNGHLLVIHHYPNGESGIDSTLVVPTGQWTCVETSFDRTTRTFKSWVDGAPATELTAPVSAETIPDPWSLFQLSGVVYHGGTTTQYYDDVALSAERIGCP